jgi:hypothetical protein
MEERYKSLTAMKAEPWIAHFQKTVGRTRPWSNKPRAIVIESSENRSRKGTGSDDEDGSKKNHENLPLTVVSPIEQSNEMAQAELVAKSDKRVATERGQSVHSQRKAVTQRLKRKRQAQSGTPSKKTLRLKDIFTQHVKR